MLQETKGVIVLTNDDGVDAPGLKALLDATQGIGQSHIVAPDGAYSGCGHRVTTHAPIVFHRREEGVDVIGGTPADCVRLARYHLEPEISWVFSGINAGGNLGVDVYHSGTVAAVREAAILGLPGIAISHYIARGRSIDWAQAARWAAAVVRQLMSIPWEAGTFWNVNLPHPAPGEAEPRVVFCDLDPSPLPLGFDLEGAQATYRGDYQKRARRPGCDVEVCFGGAISVTRLRV